MQLKRAELPVLSEIFGQLVRDVSEQSPDKPHVVCVSTEKAAVFAGTHGVVASKKAQGGARIAPVELPADAKAAAFCDEVLLLGDSHGAVTLYDTRRNVVVWRQHLHAGHIRSLRVCDRTVCVVYDTCVALLPTSQISALVAAEVRGGACEVLQPQKVRPLLPPALSTTHACTQAHRHTEPHLSDAVLLPARSSDDNALDFVERGEQVCLLAAFHASPCSPAALTLSVPFALSDESKRSESGVRSLAKSIGSLAQRVLWYNATPAADEKNENPRDSLARQIRERRAKTTKSAAGFGDWRRSIARVAVARSGDEYAVAASDVLGRVLLFRADANESAPELSLLSILKGYREAQCHFLPAQSYTPLLLVLAPHRQSLELFCFAPEAPRVASQHVADWRDGVSDHVVSLSESDGVLALGGTVTRVRLVSDGVTRAVTEAMRRAYVPVEQRHAVVSYLASLSDTCGDSFGQTVSEALRRFDVDVAAESDVLLQALMAQRHPTLLSAHSVRAIVSAMQQRLPPGSETPLLLRLFADCADFALEFAAILRDVPREAPAELRELCARVAHEAVDDMRHIAHFDRVAQDGGFVDTVTARAREEQQRVCLALFGAGLLQVPTVSPTWWDAHVCLSSQEVARLLVQSARVLPAHVFAAVTVVATSAGSTVGVSASDDTSGHVLSALSWSSVYARLFASEDSCAAVPICQSYARMSTSLGADVGSTLLLTLRETRDTRRALCLALAAREAAQRTKRAFLSPETASMILPTQFLSLLPQHAEDSSHTWSVVALQVAQLDVLRFLLVRLSCDTSASSVDSTLPAPGEAKREIDVLLDTRVATQSSESSESDEVRNLARVRRECDARCSEWSLADFGSGDEASEAKRVPTRSIADEVATALVSSGVAFGPATLLQLLQDVGEWRFDGANFESDEALASEAFARHGVSRDVWRKLWHLFRQHLESHFLLQCVGDRCLEQVLRSAQLDRDSSVSDFGERQLEWFVAQIEALLAHSGKALNFSSEAMDFSRDAWQMRVLALHWLLQLWDHGCVGARTLQRLVEQHALVRRELATSQDTPATVLHEWSSGDDFFVSKQQVETARNMLDLILLAAECLESFASPKRASTELQLAEASKQLARLRPKLWPSATFDSTRWEQLREKLRAWHDRISRCAKHEAEISKHEADISKHEADKHEAVASKHGALASKQMPPPLETASLCTFETTSEASALLEWQLSRLSHSLSTLRVCRAYQLPVDAEAVLGLSVQAETAAAASASSASSGATTRSGSDESESESSDSNEVVPQVSAQLWSLGVWHCVARLSQHAAALHWRRLRQVQLLVHMAHRDTRLALRLAETSLCFDDAFLASEDTLDRAVRRQLVVHLVDFGADDEARELLHLRKETSGVSPLLLHVARQRLQAVLRHLTQRPETQSLSAMLSAQQLQLLKRRDGLSLRRLRQRLFGDLPGGQRLRTLTAQLDGSAALLRLLQQEPECAQEAEVLLQIWRLVRQFLQAPPSADSRA